MLFRILYNLITKGLMAAMVVVLSVNYLPSELFKDFPIEPTSRQPLDYDSVIPAWNTRLSDNVQDFVQTNNLLGPESIAEGPDGLLYTGLADGRIVEINPMKNYQIRQVLKFKHSPRCQDMIGHRSPECGRFLLMKFINQTLYAIEANTGLYKIDIKSGARTFIGPKSFATVNLYNSFVFDPVDSNIVYISISSNKWNLHNIIWSILDSDSSGKIVALDMRSGKRVIVADNLMLSNGVDIDAKTDRIIFAETVASRLNYLPLPRVRTFVATASDMDKFPTPKQTLIPLLPGNPDNVVIHNDKAYIALPFVKKDGTEVIDRLAEMPSVRKALARSMFLLGSGLEYVHDKFFKNPTLDLVAQELKCGHTCYRLMKTDRSAIVEYDLATGATRLFGSDAFGFVSEAFLDSKGNMFLGSFRSPFLVRVKASDVLKELPQPTQESTEAKSRKQEL